MTTLKSKASNEPEESSTHINGPKSLDLPASTPPPVPCLRAEAPSLLRRQRARVEGAAGVLEQRGRPGRFTGEGERGREGGRVK